MRVKNISTKVYRFDELNNTVLFPGDDADLSVYSATELEQCTSLQDGFAFEDLMRLDFASQAPRTPEDYLNDLKNRSTESKTNKQVPISKTDTPKKASMHSIDRRAFSESLDNPNKYPVQLQSGFNDLKEQFTPSIHEELYSTQDEYHEDDSERLPPGVIMTEKWLPAEKKPPLTLKANDMNKRALEGFKTQSCLGSNKRTGKKCQHVALPGYMYCFAHLPEDAQKVYKQTVEILKKHSKKNKE